MLAIDENQITANVFTIKPIEKKTPIMVNRTQLFGVLSKIPFSFHVKIQVNF